MGCPFLGLTSFLCVGRSTEVRCFCEILLNEVLKSAPRRHSQKDIVTALEEEESIMSSSEQNKKLRKSKEERKKK